MKPLRQLKSSEIPSLRSHLLRKQKNICPICGKKITDPVLDHSHKARIKGTGLVRGVLCRSCNVFIAKSENNALRYGISQQDLPGVLRNTAAYLERPHLPYIHPSEAPKKKIVTKNAYNKLVKANEQFKSVPGNKGFTIPAYKYDKKGRPAQTLTKILKKIFSVYEIKVEYYK